MFSYQEQVGWVRLQGRNSDTFRLTKGTRQGSVLSPLLFSVYMDGILEALRKTKLGCHIGGVWLGAALFADDLFLMAPNILQSY